MVERMLSERAPRSVDGREDLVEIEIGPGAIVE
jgi:hypothetical protein